MEQTIKRKPISAELKLLEIGETAHFPVEQRSSVISVANRLKKELVRSNWDFKFEDNPENYTVSVIRTS